MKQRFLAWCVVILASTAVTSAFAEQVLVADGVKFVPSFRESALDFKRTTDDHVQAAVDHSENFYFSIHNGSAFDVFFAADVERPKRLREDGSRAKDSRLTYAADHLAFWSPNPNLINRERTLSSKEFRCPGEIVSSCALLSCLQEPVQ